MVAVVLGFSLLSLLLGQWSAGRVMRPVSDLANRVRAMSSADKPEPLADHFANDEVGELAQALDHYIDQLRDRAERDQAFNADVSHELRTPLAVIMGATELLQSMPDLPDKAHSRLLRIARAARQTVDITTALLYLARAERGVTNESNARDVTAITADVVEQYRPLLGTKPLRIETDLQTEVNVIAPESVLAVTIGNLLGNAIRYTPEGTITVMTASGRVEICDQGPGIDAADMPHVFDRHYRAANNPAVGERQNNTGSASGSGLGLAIVKRLASLYGWDIELKNRPEGGLSATIWFYGQSS
jgi:signal transduction histidine kinase